MKAYSRKKEPQKASYLVDEIEAIFGVNTWTIRLWANKFDLIKPLLDDHGNLLFTLAEVDKIRTICQLKDRGMSVEQIKKELAAVTERK